MYDIQYMYDLYAYFMSYSYMSCTVHAYKCCLLASKAAFIGLPGTKYNSALSAKYD